MVPANLLLLHHLLADHVAAGTPDRSGAPAGARVLGTETLQLREGVQGLPARRRVPEVGPRIESRSCRSEPTTVQVTSCSD